MKILVVDDEPLVCECLNYVLRMDGHDVEKAHSGEEALTKFDCHRFDLILTDQSMAGMKGEELAQRIRARPQPPPVIMVTAYPPNGRPPGVVRVVLKPFNTAELRRIVSEFDSVYRKESVQTGAAMVPHGLQERG